MQLLMVQFLERFAERIFNGMGMPADMVSVFKAIFFIVVLIVLCWVSNWVAKQLILSLLTKVIRRSSNRWDDVFLEKKVFSRLSHLAPVIIIFWFGRDLLSGYPEMVEKIYMVTNIYIIIVVTMVAFAVLNALEAIYENYDISRTRPIKGYMQVLKILGIFVVIILIFSMVLDRSPRLLLTGLGAASAVLMLIFRDTILNFVGGVQVTANNLVQIGDWIEMPKYGADGDVVEINLNTVKVQNFDRTITTIPTYALVSDSFKNWRGMVESGGRRIKRSIFIDAKSIRVCDQEMLKKFEKVYLLKDYILAKKAEIDRYNSENDFDESVPINGRRLTNIGTFRAYIRNYLANHPGIHKDMILMVRQLASSEKGVPLEIYAFTNDIAWVNYESIQSDIFDHILSRISYFDLKVFQDPSEFSFNIGQLTSGKEGDGKQA